MKLGHRRVEPERCALCNKSFDEVKDSWEHIIPNAIGGRKKVKGFLCRDCNLRTGQEWDSELARQLNAASIMLGIKRDKGRPPSILIDTLDGQKLRLESDGRLRKHGVEIKEQKIRKEMHVAISAPTMNELKKHLPGLVRRHPQLEGMDLMNHFVEGTKYPTSPLGIDFRFGGLEMGRSVVKSCVALAHVAGARPVELQQAREFLVGNAAPCFGYYTERDVVVKRPHQTFFHCVHVHGNERTKQLVGYAEYYSYIRIVVLLTDSYCGPEFTETYAINPIAGKEIELVVSLPDFTMQDIQDIYDYKKVDFQFVREAITPLVMYYREESRKREISRILDEALKFAFEKYRLKPEDPIPENLKAQFLELVMNHLEKLLSEYLLHLMTPPNFENLSHMIESDKDSQR